MSEGSERPPGAPSSEAVRNATGRGWSEWLDVLDRAGAVEWSHKEIVGYLEREHPGSSWWHQSIAVTFERARGKRAVGQTSDVGFQIGLRRTLDLPPGRLWDLLQSRPDLWLGRGASVRLVPGERYQVPAEGGEWPASGTVRVVRPGQRLRMTWQPQGWPAPATLQLTVSEAVAGRSVLGVHLEKLADAATRETMRAHWAGVLDRLTAASREVPPR
jgi:uncharacterized protein YndB with AHSA1/START domain